MIRETDARLKTLVERIERLEEEKKAIAGDIRDLYAEAKGAGFDPKIMRELVRLRRLDRQEQEEREALLEAYKKALGMLIDTPLGQAAAKLHELGARAEVKLAS